MKRTKRWHVLLRSVNPKGMLYSLKTQVTRAGTEINAGSAGTFVLAKTCSSALRQALSKIERILNRGARVSCLTTDGIPSPDTQYQYLVRYKTKYMDKSTGWNHVVANVQEI